jgi:plastocyanin
MAGNAWSILIVPGAEAASFVPDVYTPPDAEPRTALQAQVSDMISWSNQTGQEHEIWQTGGERITEQIDPGKSSLPAYIVGGTAPATVEYYCAIHSGETGTIDVIE